MKSFIALALATLSFSAFSQSYFVLENGITISTTTAGEVYDNAHYTPVSRVTAKGGQYIIEDSNILVTVDERGSFFRKYELLPKQVVGKGMNYFIGDNGILYTIDAQGIVHLIENNETVKTVNKFGGNFFANDQEIFVVTTNGSFAPVVVEGLKSTDIISIGGNYFMTNRGVLYTVSSEGVITSKKQNRVGILVKKGGNYFVDSQGVIYTVAADGNLTVPAIPVSLRVQAMSKLGANYFLDGSGKLFTVDNAGKVYERWLTYDLKTTKIISF